MMKRKRITAMFLSVAMAFTLMACGGETGSINESESKKDTDTELAAEKESGKKVEIRFYHMWPENESDPAVVELYKIFEDFQAENPDISLELIADAHEAWATKIKTMMAANDLPEVFISQPSDFKVYADSGVYYDFTADLQADNEWKESFVSGALDIMAKDEKVYGIPHTGYIEGVFYNQELFEKYSLKYPSTYEELVECVKVFSQNGIASFAVGAKDGWPVSMYTQFLMDREAGYDYFAKACEDETASMDNEEYRKAFDRFLELVELGAFSEGASGASHEDAKSFFMQGKAAMMINGSWEVGSYLQADDGKFGEKVKFANFPTISSGKGVQDAICVGFGKSYCISSSATDEQKEAALRFVKYMNSSKAATRLLEEGGWTQANKVSDPNPEKVSKLMKSVTDLSGSASQTWAAYGEFITPGFYDEMNKTGQKMLLKSIAAEDAVKELEKARLEFQLE